MNLLELSSAINKPLEKIRKILYNDFNIIVLSDDMPLQEEITEKIISMFNPNFNNDENGYFVEDFCLEEHNKELFGNTEFEIRKGDKLGETDMISIPLDASEFQAPIASVITISEDPNLECSMQPDFNDDKINIRLNHELNVAYNNIHDNIALRRFLAAIIVYPVLIDALFIMKNEPSKYEYEDKRWYKSIERRLDKKNISIDEHASIAVIANKLLGDIVDQTREIGD